MEYPYQVDDLARLSNISKTTIYTFLGKNKDFAQKNSTKIKTAKTKTKPKTMYSQEVLDLLLAQYGQGNDNTIVSASAGGTPIKPSSESQKHEETPPETKEDIEGYKSTINALQTKIEALEAQIEVLGEERRELVKQNGNLLLLLSQEKQEKALLLPAPKKTIGERLKGIFSKSKD